MSIFSTHGDAPAATPVAGAAGTGAGAGAGGAVTKKSGPRVLPRRPSSGIHHVPLMSSSSSPPTARKDYSWLSREVIFMCPCPCHTRSPTSSPLESSCNVRSHADGGKGGCGKRGVQRVQGREGCGYLSKCGMQAGMSAAAMRNTEQRDDHDGDSDRFSSELVRSRHSRPARAVAQLSPDACGWLRARGTAPAGSCEESDGRWQARLQTDTAGRGPIGPPQAVRALRERRLDLV